MELEAILQFGQLDTLRVDRRQDIMLGTASAGPLSLEDRFLRLVAGWSDAA